MNTYMNDLFNSLYKKYYKSINGYFSKRFDKNESEDLTQQTFIKLWAYLPTIEIIENEKSLLFAIAKTVLYDRLRQKVVDSTFNLEDISNIPYDIDFSKEIETKSLLNTLSEEDEEIFELHLFGFKSREIGAELGIRASTVRSRLARIKKELKKCY